MEKEQKKRLRRTIKLSGILLIAGIFLFFLIDNIIIPLYVQKGKTTKVPDIIGLPVEQAKLKIRSAGLGPKEAEYKTDKRYEIGTVTLQNPPADAEVKYGRGVYMTISGGEELVEVPNLKGKSVREAAFNLERCGLKLGAITYEPSDDIFANTIVRQEISPNKKIRSGDRIDVVISQGRSTDTHSIPDVSLKTLSEAEKILMDNGFRVGKVSYQVNLDLLPNTVLEQMPRAGELMKLGESIDLTITQKTESPH
jgi:serine/threonine-protein kinase